MKKVLFSLFLSLSLALFSQETPKTALVRSSGAAAAHGAYHSIALSMMLWGTGMIVGFATLAALINPSTSTSGNGNGNGGGGHAHSH